MVLWGLLYAHGQYARSLHVQEQVAVKWIFGNWRSWWQTPDGFQRVADSANATSAAGRVHGSLAIFGVNARDPMTTPALHSVWPSGRRCVCRSSQRDTMKS